MRDYILNEPEASEVFVDFVKRHHLSVEELTENQLAEAIRQSMPDFVRNICADKQSVTYIPWKEAEKYKRLYYELLYAVETKNEGETRHETALRYIQESERCGDETSEEGIGS